MTTLASQTLDEREISATELTAQDWLKLWWGFFWRGVAIVLASMVGGGLVGAVVGFILGLIGTLAGAPRDQLMLGIQIISGALGIVVSVVLFTVYVRWLLRARFGSLRLALFRSA